MRVVIQRVSQAQVVIGNDVKSRIENGYMILLGIHKDDISSDADWLIKKISSLRVFNDAEGKMNESIKEQKGEILLISQFTLYAQTKKGNRPSYITAARPEQAIPLYNYFIDKLKEEDIEVKTGEFGADMKVSLTNDGPVTIIIDSKTRE